MSKKQLWKFIRVLILPGRTKETPEEVLHRVMNTSVANPPSPKEKVASMFEELADSNCKHITIVLCPLCKGTKKLRKEACPFCDGVGWQAVPDDVANLYNRS